MLTTSIVLLLTLPANVRFQGNTVTAGPHLLANMVRTSRPDSYRVQIPPGRELAYEFAAPVFLSLAIASAGLWLVRGRRLRVEVRRALLWLSAGGLAVGYSSWWVWEHRGVWAVPMGWAAGLAVYMPALWILFSAVVLIGGMRTIRRLLPFFVIVPTIAVLGGYMFLDWQSPLWLVGTVVGTVVGIVVCSSFGSVFSEEASSTHVNTVFEPKEHGIDSKADD
jgi:hypothetical protein